MAVDDLVFSVGDKQNFLLEIPADSLNVPIDILFSPSVMDVIGKRAAGTLNTPVDWVTDGDTANGVMMFKLTLMGREVSYACIFV